MFVVDTDNKQFRIGSGCGSVGGVVDSDITGPRFEYSHRHFLNTFTVNCIEKTNMNII